MNEALSHVLQRVVLAALATVLYAIARRQRHSSDGFADIYRFHPVLPMLTTLFVAGPVAVFVDAADRGLDADLRDVLASVLGLVVAAGLIATAYLIQYRVRIDPMAIEHGAFRRQVVPLAEIVDCGLGRGEPAPLLLYDRDGRRISVPGLLGDFDSLVAKMRTHCDRMVRSGAADGSQKVIDRKRGRITHAVRWVTFLGLVVVIIVALLATRA